MQFTGINDLTGAMEGVEVLDRLTAKDMDISSFNELKRMDVKSTTIKCMEITHGRETSVIMASKFCQTVSQHFN